MASSASPSLRSLQTTPFQPPPSARTRVTRAPSSIRPPGSAGGWRRICSSKAARTAAMSIRKPLQQPCYRRESNPRPTPWQGVAPNGNGSVFEMARDRLHGQRRDRDQRRSLTTTPWDWPTQVRSAVQTVAPRILPAARHHRPANDGSGHCDHIRAASIAISEVTVSTSGPRVTSRAATSSPSRPCYGSSPCRARVAPTGCHRDHHSRSHGAPPAA